MHTSRLLPRKRADSVKPVDSREAFDDMGLRCSWAGTVWRSSPAKRGAQLQAALVARPGSCIRRLAGGHRGRQGQVSRFLYNEAAAAADKESQRWLDGMFSAAQVLREAARITVVADRESDIYEEFARRPAGVHLLTRVAQDRRIKTATDENASLFAFSDNLPEQARFVVTIPAAPGRKPRSAELALRHASVQVRKPKNGAAPDLPMTVSLTLLDIRETTAPEQGEPIHWRLV